jgi:bacteriocin biosynthesis cyclodehydratase domain-containing protein
MEVVSLQTDALLGVAEGLDVVLISDNEVLIQYGTRSYPSELLKDTDLTGVLGRLFALLLERSRTLDELLSQVGPQAQAEARLLIDDLLQRGILTDLKRSPVEQYLSYTFTGESDLGQRSIGLIGTGPIGARVAQSLLQHGVGRLTLLDGRKTDDLWHRLVPFGHGHHDHSGEPAHIVLRDRLLAAGYAGVQSVDGDCDATGVEAALASSDFLVLSLEQADIRLAHLVNRICVRDRKPWLLVTIDGNYGLVGPLFLPTHTACFNDYAALSQAAIPNRDMARRYRQHVLRRGAGSFFPGLPVYAEIVAGYASLAAVHFLLRGGSFALGRVLTLDFDRMLIDVEDVLKLPRCPVCGRERSAYQPAFSAELVTRAATVSPSQ